MRQTLMLAVMAVMTACGASGNTPWDQNHDGLITPCEGLNPQACVATAGCEQVPTACPMICRDDGHGGCLPSACDLGADSCRPTPPSQVGCNNLPPSLCAAVPMCELVQETVCSGSTTPVDPSAPGCVTAPDATQCHTTSSCVNRRPVQCETLSTDVCLTHPGCALEGSGVSCAIACDSSGNCPPCAAPQERCVTAPPPDVCGSRDANTCATDGRCVLEQGPVCDVFCGPNGNCPPCAMPQPRCVPAPPVDVCAGRDPNSCEVDGRCVIQPWACAQVCQDDGHNGCLPCNAPPPLCVPAPVSRCAGIDDATACTAAGCNLMPLGIACTTDCRDDGHGGCLPCKEFACVDPGTSGGSGGGSTPPPSP